MLDENIPGIYSTIHSGSNKKVGLKAEIEYVVNNKIAEFNQLKIDIENKVNEITGSVDKLNSHDTKISNNEKAITYLETGGLNIMSQGAIGDGSIASPAIDATFNITTMSPVQTVIIPDGVFKINKPIVVPRGVHLQLSQKTVIQPTSGDFNIFQLKPEGKISGGYVDLQNVTFTGAVFYLDAADVFQFYGQSAVISDINVLNKVPPVAGAFTGTGILCEAATNMAFVDNVKFNNLTFINFDKVIHLRVDPILDIMFEEDPNTMAWINANYFFQITAQNFKYGIYMEGKGGVPRDVGGNMFTQCQFQAEATTEAIVYCEGAYNTFDLFLWDLHKMDDSKQAIQFAKSSKFNKINSAMQLEITESWKDEGYMNIISSPGNYVNESRSGFAQRISTPYKGAFNGNQDDAMINGHLRGYTVTQTSGPAPVGVLNDIFIPDSEQGPTWTMTPDIDYMNPITLEIDCSTDPVVYAQYIGTMHPWDSVPEGLRVEGWTGTEWIWLHEVKGNTSNDFLISPPYSAIDFLHKIKISFYGSPKLDKKVTIGRLVAISSKNLGKAYIPQFTDTLPMVDANGVAWNIKLNTDGTWANTGVTSPSIPPILPGEKTMAGDQDDNLLLADKRYVVTSSGAVKTSGNIADMFSMKREAFCRWTNPTTGAPIVLEIDFGTTPIQYMESFGLNFGWTETPKNIKVERVLTSGGAYSQAINITNNTAATFHMSLRATNIYKIRVTISVPNNANTLVRINRIFGTASTSLPASFVNIEGDNKVYGNFEFGDTTKGIIMKSPDGSRFKFSIDNNGVITTTKL